jgi:hypothetical protein
MTFQEQVDQKKMIEQALLEGETSFDKGVSVSKEILTPCISKIMETFEEIKKFVAVESLVGQKLKAAIKEYKELEL